MRLKILGKMSVTALKTYGRQVYGVPITFCCPAGRFSTANMCQLSVLVIHPNHWNGIIDTLLASQSCQLIARCLVVVDSCPLFLGIMSLKKKIGTLVALIEWNILLYVYVHTNMYVRYIPLVYSNFQCVLYATYVE